MLSVGHPLPDLACDATLPDGRIELIELAAFRGKWLVLFFWPLDFSRACQNELREYSELAHDFDLSGAALLGVSVDSALAHQAWVRHGLGPMRFPMLGDVKRELTQAFGVLGDAGVAQRANFIANPEGRVVSVAACDPVACRPARETLRLLHALQSGELAASVWRADVPIDHAA